MASGRAHADPPRPPSVQGAILVIDDTPEVAALVRAHLELAGYDVRVASCGADGLAAAAAEPPDLILLDVMMPGMNGYEVCQRLREAETTRYVPIIVLSAVPGRAAMVRALDIGADDFLAKPFHGDELLARVRAHVRKKRLHDAQANGSILIGEDPETRELREAIADRQLVLHYQPKRNAQDRQLIGVESLVRWRHPTRGLLPPGEFLPLAERTGLIRPLGEAVLENALRQCHTWQQAGHSVPVAVNMSASDLQDLRTPALTLELLMRCRVPPQDLTIELTESAMVADPVRAIEILTRLRDQGVRISIDDFGTGYSSLSYLRRLPVDELKIDRSFVAEVTTDIATQTIVRGTIALAHDLGLHVVAEGVESQETWDCLTELGCDIVQGFFLGRPVPADALEIA